MTNERAGSIVGDRGFAANGAVRAARALSSKRGSSSAGWACNPSTGRIARRVSRRSRCGRGAQPRP